MAVQRHYRAFISYSHSDEAWARWLQRALEGYRLPKSLRQSHPNLPARLFPIFRDRDELASGGDLSESIRKAIPDILQSIYEADYVTIPMAAEKPARLKTAAKRAAAR